MPLSKPLQLNLGQMETFPVHTNIKLVSLFGLVWQDNHQDPLLVHKAIKIQAIQDQLSLQVG